MGETRTFRAWQTEHYGIVGRGTGADFVCKRCGERTGYLEKHATEVHGDNIAEWRPAAAAPQ